MTLANNCIQFWNFEKGFKGVKDQQCIYDDEHYPIRFISVNDTLSL